MNGQGENYSAGLGGSIGGRVARLVADASVHTRARMGPHQAAVAQKVLQDFTNHVSDELRPVMGPLWSMIADDENAPEYLRALARALADERGQAWAWIAGTATSSMLGAGLLAVITNELQPMTGATIRSNPHMPLSPADAALLVSRGLWDHYLAEGDAGQAGIDANRFARLVDANRITLPPGDLMQLYGKGHLDRESTVRLLGRYGMDTSHAQLALPLARTWVSLPDGGAMVQRGIIDEAQLREIAVRNGHDVGDAVRYSELAGEPLPVQALLTAQRRGFIDTARTYRGWVQGPVRNEWFDVAQELQYSPMTTVDAADSVNQGHMTREQGAVIAGWNGLMPEHFGTLIENAGLPPGVELATEAWNRGLLTETEFESAFLESRLKNRYVPLYKALRWRVVPQETVRRLFREKQFTREQAYERLGWAGFDPETRNALLDAEAAKPDESTRELSKSESLALFADRAITEATLREFLAVLKYSPSEVDLLVTLAEIRRERRYVDAVISRVRAGYVAFQLDQTDAVSIMDSLRIPPDQREELLNLWDLERLAVTRALTPAQVKSAMRKGLIGEGDALTRLTHQGYSDVDAAILLAI